MQTMSMLKKYGQHLKYKMLVSIMICMFNAIHYCLQMYLKTLEKSVMKYMNLILLIFCLQQISMASMFKKDKSTIIIINRHLYAIDN